MANPSLRCTIPVGSNPPIVQIRTKQYNQDFATHQNVPVALNHTGVIIDVAKPGQPQDLRIACTLLRADGQLCGSVLKNQDHNVRSHKSDLHKPGSEYERNQDPSKVFVCGTCGRASAGFNTHLQHCRSGHDYRGSQNLLKGDLAI